jgi:hypothetical protein
MNAYDFMNADNVIQCCKLCFQESGQCAAFSFLEDKKMCYVYSSPLPSQTFRNFTIGGVPNPSYRSKNLF